MTLVELKKDKDKLARFKEMCLSPLYNQVDVMKEFGIGRRQTIASWATSLGIKWVRINSGPSFINLSKERKQLFIDMTTSKDYDMKDIIEEFNICEASIFRWCNKLNIVYVKVDWKSKLPNNIITEKILKEVLHYDKVSGIFTWLVTRSPKAKKDSIAGTKNNEGYIVIKIYGKAYPAAQLAILYEEGWLPSYKNLIVDHQNHIKYDNSFANLSIGTHADNMKNKLIYKNNTTGYSGIYYSDNLYNIHIEYNKIKYKRKKISTMEEAIIQRDKIYKKLGFHENHGKTLEQIQESI